MNRAPIRSRSATLALAVALALLGAVPAGAVDRSEDAFVELAREARLDPVAEAALLETTSIDGTPISIGWVLGDDETRHVRLGALIAEHETASEPAATAIAVGILSQERFDTAGGLPTNVVLQAWVMRLMSGVLNAIEETIPGGLATVGWILLIAAIAGISAVTLSLMRRRERAIEEAAAGPHSEQQERPSALDRAASAAERRGDLEEALRLRFRAALLRLDAHGAIRFHEGITSGQVVEEVPHRLVPALVGAHDEVVYGGRPPTDDDARASRDDWPRVIREVTP